MYIYIHIYIYTPYVMVCPKNHNSIKLRQLGKEHTSTKRKTYKLQLIEKIEFFIKKLR